MCWWKESSIGGRSLECFRSSNHTVVIWLYKKTKFCLLYMPKMKGKFIYLNNLFPFLERRTDLEKKRIVLIWWIGISSEINRFLYLLKPTFICSIIHPERVIKFVQNSTKMLEISAISFTNRNRHFTLISRNSFGEVFVLFCF